MASSTTTRPARPRSGKPSVPGKPGTPAAEQGPKPESKILFQKFFKSVGPRTYAAQIKEATNGNHFLVLTEGKRDEKTNELRKARVFLYSEDFVPFFRMLHETAQFIKANPVPEEVRRKRERYWAKANSKSASSGPTRGSKAPATPR